MSNEHLFLQNFRLNNLECGSIPHVVMMGGGDMDRTEKIEGTEKMHFMEK